MKNKTYLLLVFLFSSTLVNAQLEPPHALNENQFLEFRRDLPLSQPKELPPDCFEALNLAFDNSVATSTIKGFTASLVTPDGSVWKRASGLSQELPTESLLTTDHLMGMASNTKSFVSATLLLMYEEGLLSLDDSIGTYIDEYPNIPSTVSIQQLLSHRSGISDYINENPLWIEDLELYIDSIWTIDNLLQAYVLEPNFPVDSTYSYSNTNYLLAALIIESIANVPWYEEVRARVLEPLNLTHTFSYPFESIDTNEISHMWIELDWDTLGIDTMGLFDVQGIGLPIEGYFSIASSAGNLLTTAEDLAIFRKKLHGGDLLLPATLEEMQTNYSPEVNNFDYGLGVVSYSDWGIENWGHSGSWTYKSNSFYFGEYDFSIAVLQNDYRSGVDYHDTWEVMNDLINAYLSCEPTGINELQTNDVVIYPNPSNGVFQIELSEHSNISFPITCYVTNSQGQRIGAYVLESYKSSIDLEHLSEGLYIIRIDNLSKKVIKK